MKTTWTFLSAFVPAILVSPSCLGRQVNPAEPECQSPTRAAPLPADAVSLFQGRFAVEFVGTGGAAAGRKTSGLLVLWARPDSLQGIMRLDGTDDPDLVEIAFGGLEGDLQDVEAVVEGSVSSRDPEQPGVVVRRRRRAADTVVWSYELQFGSGRNRRGIWILDGASTDAEVTSASQRGFAGFWKSTAGPTTYEASGHFCATIMPGQR